MKLEEIDPNDFPLKMMEGYNLSPEEFTRFLKIEPVEVFESTPLQEFEFFRNLLKFSPRIGSRNRGDFYDHIFSRIPGGSEFIISPDRPTIGETAPFSDPIKWLNNFEVFFEDTAVWLKNIYYGDLQELESSQRKKLYTHFFFSYINSVAFSYVTPENNHFLEIQYIADVAKNLILRLEENRVPSVLEKAIKLLEQTDSAAHFLLADLFLCVFPEDHLDFKMNIYELILVADANCLGLGNLSVEMAAAVLGRPVSL